MIIESLCSHRGNQGGRTFRLRIYASVRDLGLLSRPSTIQRENMARCVIVIITETVHCVKHMHLTMLEIDIKLNGHKWI